MAIIADRLNRLVRQWLEATGNELREVFGVSFLFWELTVDEGPIELYPNQEPIPDPLVGLSVRFSDATHRVVAADQPGIFSVGLRLCEPGGREFLATSQLSTSAPAMLEQLTRSFVIGFERQQRSARLELENLGLLHQVTNDLEELYFLRNMAELLEISDLTRELPSMVEPILPALQQLCECEAFVMLSATSDEVDEHHSRYHAIRVSRWYGELPIDEDACRRLVDMYHTASLEQPIVKNSWASTHASIDFPGLHGFILVPIVNSSTTCGWLLALNRDNDDGLPSENLPWEVSIREFGTSEATLIGSTAAILGTHARNLELFREREELLVSVVRAMVSAIETKDEYTRGHSERVALYGRRLGVELGLGDAAVERLYLTGLLHDVGKIGVSDAVLRKQGPLTEEEFEEIKQHPEKGWAILQDLDALNYVLPGVLHHHERIDGDGYPDRLKGDSIPLTGRILAVADAFDAMTSDRPYRSGMPVERAIKIIESGAGTQWDNGMVDAFLNCLPDILQIKNEYQSSPVPKRVKPATEPGC